MEKNRVFVIVVVSLGVLALVFQAIGFFAPAWISYDMNINSGGTNMNIEIDMGLWATTGCLDSPALGGEECRSFTNDELRELIGQGNSGTHETAKVAGLNFLDDFTKVQVLTTLGGLCSVIGLILLSLFSKVNGTKTFGIPSALSWGIGGIFVFAAVGLQAQHNSNFIHGMDIMATLPNVSNKIDIKVNFPWAILMSGIGAFLNIVVAGFTTFKTCYMNDPNGPGLWNRFSNQAV